MDLALKALLVVAQHLRLGPQELALLRICRRSYSEVEYTVEYTVRQRFPDWKFIVDRWPELKVLHASSDGQEVLISLPVCQTWPITDAWSLLCAALVSSNDYHDFRQLENTVTVRSEPDLLFVSIGHLELKFDLDLDYVYCTKVEYENYREVWMIRTWEPGGIALELELKAQGMGFIKLTVWKNLRQKITSICWLPNTWLSEIRDQLEAIWQTRQQTGPEIEWIESWKHYLWQLSIFGSVPKRQTYGASVVLGTVKTQSDWVICQVRKTQQYGA